MVRASLIAYEPDLERVCAAAMRSCYSPHPGYELFTHTQGSQKTLEGERVFDRERVSGLLKRALELGHYDILEHNSLTWLVEGATEKEIVKLLDSSRYFETTRLNDDKWLITTNLRVIVEQARNEKTNGEPLIRQLVQSLSTAAPSVATELLPGYVLEAEA